VNLQDGSKVLLLTRPWGAIYGEEEMTSDEIESYVMSVARKEAAGLRTCPPSRNRILPPGERQDGWSLVKEQDAGGV
jgi:hypothetical protein